MTDLTAIVKCRRCKTEWTCWRKTKEEWHCPKCGAIDADNQGKKLHEVPRRTLFVWPEEEELC